MSGIRNILISDLVPYANNSRTHSDEQVAQIAASIQEWGFTNPILIDEKKRIIAGHGRVQAARKVGMEDVPCVVLSGLTEAQLRAYVIADNKLALNAGWDFDILKLEVESIAIGFDVNLIGFSCEELSSLFDVTKDIEIDSDNDNKEDEPGVICVKFDKKHRVDALNAISLAIENIPNAVIDLSYE